MIKNFSDLWRAHFEWCEGVLLKKIKLLETADLYFGYPPTEWFNFALPKVEKPTDLDLKEIKKVLFPVSPPTAVYLFEEHIKGGFPKFLTHEVFSQVGYDDPTYNEICHKTLTGEMKSKTLGFSSGLFLTKEIGYFHNDATFKEYRKKGYHTALIKERIRFCLDKGIKALYSIVEFKSQSFRNYQKCGFETWQVCNLFTIKSK